MKDIINQIIQIDSLADENKKKNVDLLAARKKDYTRELSTYKNEKISIAKKNAELINQSIQADLSKQESNNSSKLKNLSIEMEKKYLQVEKDAIQKVFNKLFVLEG
ncbi:MAG: hypothetical protein ACERLG_02620 [Sedimentibacter sp.]